MATIKHLKTSVVADSGDASLVQPSDWNADHTLTGLVAADVSDFDTAVEAVAPVYTASATAPATPKGGDTWLDTDTGILYTWVVDTGGGQWVELGPGSSGGTTTGGFPYFYAGAGAASVFDGAFDLSGDAVIRRIALVGTGGGLGFTSADLSGCTSLEKISATAIGGLATIDFTGCTSLTYADIFNNGLTGVTLTGATALEYLDASSSPGMTTVDISDNVLLLNVYFTDGALDEANVDGVLADLDAAGLSNGEVDLSGGTNSAPSAAGLTSKSNLEGKGWTVTVNP